MSHVFDEGGLRFIFDETFWQVLKWDDHAAHRKSMNVLDGSKAIDFMGIYRGEALFFIEAKDYREHDRSKEQPLTQELELKVRNTVAGLVGGCRREEYKAECSPFLEALRRKDLWVVLWLETKHDRKSKFGEALELKNLKQRFKWLSPHVATCHADDYARVIPGLTVTSLPRSPAKA